MAQIKPFAAIRPANGLEEQVAALPYDVYNRMEAKHEIKDKPNSFLRVDRPETSFEDSVGTYDACVYEKAKELFYKLLEDNILIQDNNPCYYIYELTMNGRAQTGLVACASIDDYLSGVVMKHENTREDKEVDRIKHVSALEAQTGPIFLAYKTNERIHSLIYHEKEKTPYFQFTTEDGVQHKGWIINDSAVIENIMLTFQDVNKIYIADGHHRCASAVKVGLAKRSQSEQANLSAEYNYFLSVLFPDDELLIMDYNRVVKDLNGLSENDFMNKLKQYFIIEKKQEESELRPYKKGNISMYLKSGWYGLTVKEAVKNSDPVEGLDVSILQKFVLSELLDIHDPRTDQRIDFVGGIRGLKELERRVNDGNAVAFAMFPPSIGELFAVSDAGKLMPPKSTWFEPKLRSGLFIHSIK